MLYEAMFKRKSVRKYSYKPLEKKILGSVVSYINHLERLFPNIKTEFQLLSKDEVKTTIKAPHYIAVFSEKKEGYLPNVGFMLEQLDLFLSENNIGACWLGIAKPIKEIMLKSNLPFVILLAFGNGEKEIHRKDVSEFNRKEIELISNIDNEISQTVRLAPSAMNSQPWYYKQEQSEIDIYVEKNSLIKNMILGDKNKIDIGISICYLNQLVKQKEGKVEFKILANKELEKHEYVITANIK